MSIPSVEDFVSQILRTSDDVASPDWSALILKAVRERDAQITNALIDEAMERDRAVPGGQQGQALWDFATKLSDDGRDPRLLRPGKRVKIMITGNCSEYVAVVLDERKYGVRKLRVVAPLPSGGEHMADAVLQDGDYILRGYEEDRDKTEKV